MWAEKRIIYDITPFSLLDFPDITSCILWFAGCNMRCSYCYNPDIVFGKGQTRIADALLFIESRKGLLDGVVLSGGECTLYKEIIPLANEIKKNGMLLKIDTNGSHPERIQELVEQNLMDYVSLDFKALPHKFEAITQSNCYSKFEQTLALLQKSGIPFEVRTTFHSALFSEHDLTAMTDHLASLGYSGKYYLQNFVNDTKTIGDIQQRHKKMEAFHRSEHPIEVVVRN